MNLYIETENGVTKNHPAFEDNLIQVFGKIPDHWEPFVRVERPVPGIYQVLVDPEPTYAQVDGVWTDVWSVRDMTAEEKTARQQATKQVWAALPDRDNFTAWTFDEATCSYQPPVPRPTDGKNYYWQGKTNSWVEMPARPEDGKQYRFDVPTNSWIELPPRPTDDKQYRFDVPTNSWIEIPPRPTDDKQYRFDANTNNWVEITQ